MLLVDNIAHLELNAKVYGFYHENDKDQPVVLRFTGESTALFGQFYYLFNGEKGVDKAYKFLPNTLTFAPYKDGWIPIPDPIKPETPHEPKNG